jgi:hypothetical protein
MERRKEGKSSTSQLQRGGSTKVKSFSGETAYYLYLTLRYSGGRIFASGEGVEDCVKNTGSCLDLLHLLLKIIF